MKKRLYRKITAVFMAVLILLNVSACGGGSSTGSDMATDAELNVGFAALPVTMDAQMAFDSASFSYLDIMVGTLFRADSNGEISNELATGYEVSEDGLVYTITLRDDIRYSNGDRITAQDFVYSMERIADPLVGSNAIYVFENICEVKNIADVNTGKLPISELGVTATDERTLVIELEKPCPYFINLLTMPCAGPCSRAFVESCDDLYATEAKYLLGSGKYYIDRYEPFDTQMHYSPNPYYFDKESVQFPGISVRYVQSLEQSMMCYESGILDIIYLSGSIQELAEGDNNVSEKSSGSIYYIGTIPSHNAALGNQNIRRALSMTINRDSIVKNITKKGTSALERIVPAGFCVDAEGNDFVSDVNEYKDICGYNIDAARGYWAEGLKEIGADSVHFTMLSRSTNQNLIDMLVNDWEKNLPGLTIEVKTVPAKQYYDEIGKKEADLYLAGWGADYADPNAFLELFTSHSDYNYADFYSERFDNLIDNAMLETNPELRYEMLHEAEDIVMNEGYFIPVYAEGGAWLISDKVKNVGLIYNGSLIDISEAYKVE